MGKARFHLVLPDSLEKAVKEMGRRWGLDRTNTIRHCIALAWEEMREKIDKEKATKRLHEPK
jgi:hypothetical protein